jgi:hypothetical protein
MFIKVTGQQVKDAVISSGIIEIKHHDCAICGVWTRYLVVEHSDADIRLHYDASCGCAWGSQKYIDSRDAGWKNAAEFINMQSNEHFQKELLKSFGFESNENQISTSN